MELACRSTPPDMYLEASVAMVKGFEVSGRCRTGLVRKQFFSLLKAFWQEFLQFHRVSFLVREWHGFPKPVRVVGTGTCGYGYG